MNLNFVFFINSILFGVGLAMDAFSVSLANGLNEPKIKAPKIIGIASTFGFFQFAMPMIGWVCVHTIVEAFSSLEKFIPWIALALLLYIGGKMLIEGIKGNSDESKAKKLTVGALVIQGIATSIDALSVGFTIADLDFFMALTESLIIGLVTAVICVCGLLIGKTVGDRLSNKASILGGIILIGIGLEIFLTGIL